MRDAKTLLLSILLLAIAVGPPAIARNRTDPTIDPFLVAAGFLDGHPDLLHRTRGLDAYGEKDHPRAFAEFKRAAWYGDKPSQAIVGEMLWIGLGTELDRAAAYVWMELAADRGYTSFVRKRDMYWSQLQEHERDRARALGPSIRAEYGDDVTGPRLAQVFKRELRKMTGSRLGSQTSQVQVHVPGVGTMDASQYYRPEYWDPVQYRQWQDRIWTNVRIGQVSVGAVEQVREATDAGPAAEPAPTGEPADRPGSPP
ncbi:sel1 repeat family protein [Luteimonas wenzhouensis]|uniref:Sel1 repeat family protein n=1 Tax=Luteimonas wenzhouensis TaxID=2599615 RepID=A0A5C5U3I5_9GAMM|nr:sel1 repeat family protein [Luteimonas wenzhouensis]TWT20486.1 sel1 repeat family protein [Luteimonas wenzhouensis]